MCMCNYCTYIASTDFDPGPFNITIQEGSTEVTFNFPIINDKIYENDESFQLYITNTGFPDDFSVKTPDFVTIEILEDDCKYFNLL